MRLALRLLALLLLLAAPAAAQTRITSPGGGSGPGCVGAAATDVLYATSATACAGDGNLTWNSATTVLQLLENSQQYQAYLYPGFIRLRETDGFGGGTIYLESASGGTVSAPLTTASGDELGRVAMRGYSGAFFFEGATLVATAEGAPGAFYVPTRMSIATAPAAGPVTERLRLDSTGTARFGDVASLVGNAKVVADGAAFYIAQPGGGVSTYMDLVSFSGGATTPYTAYQGLSARGTAGAATAVASGDYVLEISAQGFDGTNYKPAGLIDVFVDGAVAAGVVPGRIDLSTTSAAGASAKRLRVDKAGIVTLYGDGTQAAGSTSFSGGSGSSMAQFESGSTFGTALATTTAQSSLNLWGNGIGSTTRNIASLVTATTSSQNVYSDGTASLAALRSGTTWYGNLSVTSAGPTLELLTTTGAANLTLTSTASSFTVINSNTVGTMTKLTNTVGDIQLLAGNAHGFSVTAAKELLSTGVAFASLGTPANGSFVFCSDCDAVTLLTCTSAGTKTGAFAYRLNGLWKCVGA